jgi:hypothetical protein
MPGAATLTLAGGTLCAVTQDSARQILAAIDASCSPSRILADVYDSSDKISIVTSHVAAVSADDQGAAPPGPPAPDSDAISIAIADLDTAIAAWPTPAPAST